MIFHIFFLTITIEKNTNRKTDKLCEAQYKQAIEEMRNHKSSYYTHMS